MINVAWHRAGESQVVKYATTPCSTWYCDSSDMTTKCVVESGFIYPMLFLFVRLSVFFFHFMLIMLITFFINHSRFALCCLEWKVKFISIKSKSFVFLNTQQLYSNHWPILAIESIVVRVIWNDSGLIMDKFPFECLIVSTILGYGCIRNWRRIDTNHVKLPLLVMVEIDHHRFWFFFIDVSEQ